MTMKYNMIIVYKKNNNTYERTLWRLNNICITRKPYT